jgi:hypothetical protein
LGVKSCVALGLPPLSMARRDGFAPSTLACRLKNLFARRLGKPKSRVTLQGVQYGFHGGNQASHLGAQQEAENPHGPEAELDGDFMTATFVHEHQIGTD